MIQLKLNNKSAIALHNLILSLRVLGSTQLPDEVRRRLLASMADDRDLQAIESKLQEDLNCVSNEQENRVGRIREGDRA